MYFVDCSAEALEFGITLGNQTFYHDGSDIIYQTSGGYCISALASSNEVSIGNITLNIIGVSLLKSMVAVYEMRFTKK